MGVGIERHMIRTIPASPPKFFDALPYLPRFLMSLLLLAAFGACAAGPVRADSTVGNAEAGMLFSTGWAWALWVASTLLLLALLLRWRVAALRRHNRELAVLIEHRTAELRKANEALAVQSTTDALTGMKNRRYLYDHIEQDLAMARRNHEDRQCGRAAPPQNMDLLFLMVDIDRFKEVNDNYGHAAGDRVLQQLRDVLMMVARESDTPVRWGGEEFLIVVRCAPPDFGPRFAERVRAAVANYSFDLGNGQTIRRTCSIGFASYPAFSEDPDGLNWEQVVNLADECLYAAKRHGRDAWIGLAAMQQAPSARVIEALHESLVLAPGSGPLRVLSSWGHPAEEVELQPLA